MPEALKYLIDAAVAFGLFLALMLVFLVDWVFFSSEPAPRANTLKGVVLIERKSGDGKKLRLAVTPTATSTNLMTGQKEPWDDMGKLLKGLGEGYADFDTITEQQILRKDKKLRDYDVLFLTCAGGGEELADELRDFVAEGGILYASDWRYNAVATAFKEMKADKLAGEGDRHEKLVARIVDPALREALGQSSVELKFDLPEWKTAAFSGPRVKELMRGRYRINKSAEFAEAPLMVKFAHGKGTVIFTSFHNEKQNSRVETELLKYLVFSLVTAGIGSEINSTLNKEGFTAQRSNLLSTPRKESVKKEYKNDHPCTLRFVLGFRNEGKTLRFNIKAPNGEEYTHDAKSTVILEVPNAQAGTWTYTATALDTYDNFAFIMTVGEKK